MRNSDPRGCDQQHRKSHHKCYECPPGAESCLASDHWHTTEAAFISLDAAVWKGGQWRVLLMENCWAGPLYGGAHIESFCDWLDDLDYAVAGIDLLAEADQSELLELVHVPSDRTAVAVSAISARCP